jgi:hypothetical protein
LVPTAKDAASSLAFTIREPDDSLLIDELCHSLLRCR